MLNMRMCDTTRTVMEKLFLREKSDKKCSIIPTKPTLVSWGCDASPFFWFLKGFWHSSVTPTMKRLHFSNI